MKNEPNKSVSNISLRFRPKQGQSSTGKIVSEMEKYDDCPLLLSLITTDSTRAKRLTEDGYKQMTYPQSNDGWAKTLFVIEQRGLRNFWQPWCLSVLNATIWTVLSETRDVGGDEADVESWGFFIGVLNASLAFLLVFRLNRAAERYWVARATWGKIVSSGRHFIDSILVHGKHQPHYQDEAIRWTLAFSVAAMQYIRGDAFDSELFAGVLEPSEVDHMASMVHPPLYASSQIRAALKEIFEVTESTTVGVAMARSQQLALLEGTLNTLTVQQATMERIKGTPLPMVYVTHLRTFLLLFLLILPYVWQPAWGWPTIAVMAIISFALLGLEGAAQEVEAPFERDHPNHLNMDGYCLMIFKTTIQLLKDSADRDTKNRQEEEIDETET